MNKQVKQSYTCLYYRPIGFQEVEAPRFIDNGNMKIIRLSALHINHLNTRSAKAVNLTAADFLLSIFLNPCIVLTRHV